MTRNFLKTAIVFLCGFVLFHTATVVILSQLQWGGGSLLQRISGNFTSTGGYGQSLARFREAEKVGHVDVLIAGSSHAYRGFDPRIFKEHGISTFNMGSSSQSPLNTYYLLKRYLPDFNPKLVILEVYPEVLTLDGLESSYDLLVNLPISSELITMGLQTKNPHAVNLMLASYFGRLLKPLETCTQSPVAGERYIAGGYCESYAVKANTTPQARARIYGPLSVQDRQLEYLEKIINLLKGRSVPILAVVHPLPTDTIRQMTNYDEVIGKLRGLAKHNGVELLDFNETMHLDQDKDFMDSDHLNANGVMKFNRALLDSMLSNQEYRRLFVKGSNAASPL